MTLTALTAEEVAVVEAVRKGEPARFTAPATIRGELIRALALGRELPAPAAGGAPLGKVTPAGARIHVDGARIEGLIDLEGIGSVEGQGALSLLLETCQLAGDAGASKDGDGLPAAAFSALGARLAHLSLRGSRFARIELGRAHFAADVNLCHVGPLPGDEDKTCWVRARGVTVGGAFLADCAELRVQARDPASIDNDRPRNFALELSEADIRGALNLNAARAHGGVILRNTRIDSEVWMIATHIEKGESDAIAARALKVGGGVSLRRGDKSSKDAPDKPFTCIGHIELDFADIGGYAEIAPTVLGDANAKETAALSAWCGKFGWLTISGEVHGPLLLGRVQVANDVGVNAVIDADTPYAVAIGGAKIGGSLTLDGRAQLTGSLSLEFAEIGHSLVINGAVTQRNANLAALWGPQVRVQGDVQIAGAHKGEVNFGGANIGGSVTFARGAAIEGTASLEFAEIGMNFESRATITPNGAGRALSAAQMHAKGDVLLAGAVIGEVNFDGATIEGIFQVGADDAPLLFRWKRGAVHKLSLKDARIARALRFASRRHARRTSTREELEGATFEAPPPGLARARARKLSFYPGWSLVEVQFDEEHPRLRCFLVKDEAKADDADAVIALDGSSGPIHSMNERLELKLADPAQAKEYLLFFCAMVWADEGAFNLLEKNSGLMRNGDIRRLVRGKEVEPKVAEAGEDLFRCSGYVVYGAAVFTAEFALQRSGMIEMLDDDPVGQIKSGPPALYGAGARRAAKPGGRGDGWRLEPPFRGAQAWSDGAPEQRAAIRARLGVAEDGDTRERSKIDCSGAQIGLLDDNWGDGWPRDSRLLLGGLTYERLSEATSEHPHRTVDAKGASREAFGGDARAPGAPASGGASKVAAIADTSAGDGAAAAQDPDSWKKRREWLLLQYEARRAPSVRSQYNPQPYEQLIAALFAMGDNRSARKMSRFKLQIESGLGGGERAGASLAPTSARARGVWTLFCVAMLALAGVLAAGRAAGAALPAAIDIAAPLLALGAAGALALIWGRRLLLWLYGFFFGYGLSPLNALWTVIGFIGAGAAASWFAASGWPAVSFGGVTLIEASGPVLLSVRDGAPVGPACTVIDPFWYALDTFVPLADLRQESRCDIDPARTGWVAARGLYALAGWLVTSLAILTMSGLLRRYAERG